MMMLFLERVRPASGAATVVALVMAGAVVIASAGLVLGIYAVCQAPICGVRHVG